MVKHGLNADREVIFVDQRGTHHADPCLGCRGGISSSYDAVSLPFAAESTAADAAAIQECRDQLAATGVDLAAYNSAENAADIADLRVAMGIDTWNVYGVSYGSKLALVRPARSPAGHPQRGPRFGVAPHEQHRRELVDGSGQLVQGDLRCVCGPAHLREPPTRTWKRTSPPR